MADRAADRRAARRPRRARPARDLPALLRPHVHQSEGRAVRGGDGGVPARPGARVRGISEAVVADASHRSASASACRSARASSAASACSTALPRSPCSFALEARAAGIATRGRTACSHASCAHRRARDPRLRGDGAGLALGRDRSAQSASRHRRVLALLREAVAGAVRRRPAHAAGHAAPLRAGTARPQLAADFQSAWHRGRRWNARRRHAKEHPGAQTPRPISRSRWRRLLPVADRGRHTSGDVQRRPAFPLHPAAARGRCRSRRRMHSSACAIQKWRDSHSRRCSSLACCCRWCRWRGCIPINMRVST